MPRPPRPPTPPCGDSRPPVTCTRARRPGSRWPVPTPGGRSAWRSPARRTRGENRGPPDLHHPAHRQRRPPGRRGRAAPAARGLPARGSRVNRYPHRLRAGRLRHLHGAAERGQHPLLHHPGGAGRRRRGEHGRGPGRGRRAAPAAGRVLRQAGPAVRVLHPGHADAGAGDPRAEPGSHRRTGAGGHRQQPVPLHRVPVHHRGRARRRRAAARAKGGRAVTATSREAAAPPVRDHAPERRWVGRSIRRIEDPKFLRGQGGYIADRITPGTLHAAVLRSPHPHARILRMDVTQARALPGVHAVITGKEAAELCDPMPDFGPDPARHTWRCLAADKVRYVGEGVAVAVADSRYLAEDALELIEVEYEPLPAVTDPEQALAAGAPLVHEALESNCAYERTFDFGEVERDFAGADVVVTDRLRWPRSGGQP